MLKKNNDVELQRQYYGRTAHEYNGLHAREKDEHLFALCLLTASLDYLGIRTILDIGSGTGRVISHIKGQKPYIHIVGVEPVKELREIGYMAGISRDELFDGDATNLSFYDNEFDMVCEFGMLHHIRDARIAIAEMLRIASKAIFISDSNNFGQGSTQSRLLKQTINALGLWKAANLMKTRGRGYSVSEGDGISYSYSVFNDYQYIRDYCEPIHIINTSDGRLNPYKSASHVALLAMKKVNNNKA